MPSTLDTRIHVGIQATQTSPLDLIGVSAPLSVDSYLALGSGTAAGQADRMFTDTRTLAASATEDLDLVGTLTDAFGGTVTFARVKALYVRAAIGNTNNVLVGGAATNGFITWVGAADDKVALRPGGFVLLGTAVADATGYATTAATADLLRIGNSGAGTSVTYDIVVIGASA